MPLNNFPFYRQLDQMDCGPSCLRMIAKHFGKTYSLNYLRKKSHITREGVSVLGLSEAAESIGFRTLTVAVPIDSLLNEVPLPCIAHWRQRHFVVVYKSDEKNVYVADPAIGCIKYPKEKFVEGWLYNKKKDDDGVLILLEASPEFYEKDGEEEESGIRGFSFMLHYLKPFRKFINQLILGVIASIIIQLVFPFTARAIVDYGIHHQDIGFIYLILGGQIVLFFSQTSIGIIRNWVLLHMGSRINISIISDFLSKMMRLPISYFDSKMKSDLIQRIEDNRRIENFLSSVTLNGLFSFISLIVFGSVLAIFNVSIFLIFLVSTVMHLTWVLLFARRRAILDYIRHDQSAENRSSILQLINGISEIKLNNSELRRRWEWEAIQVKLFKTSSKGLALAQLQSTGANFINEFKNIVITVIAANDVVAGNITLGTMLAIQYILGQLNGPMSDIISFIQSGQDAKLSMNRLSEIHQNKNEDENETDANASIPQNGDIILKNVSFQYGGPNSRRVLDDVSITIPQGKVTAIVGISGSGKTTLLKLLLKFYPPTEGRISIGAVNLSDVNASVWRKECGVVMQDGFIFADTIARNITESSSEEFIDKKRLEHSVDIANLSDTIENMPMGFSTNLSWGGITLSGGENQRVLIARAIYKNPSFVLFDEATSSLDANNERKIMEKLYGFYAGRTVVIVAHRLSTVKNADQIVVLKNGKVAEVGTHDELTKSKKDYYELVKNQLELGN